MESAMLVLTRKPGESIEVPDCNLTFTILETRGGRVRVSITAPREVGVCRTELLEELERQEQAELPARREAVA
jgi:carbon storage regulator CsrA